MSHRNVHLRTVSLRQPVLLGSVLLVCLMLGGCFDRLFFKPDYALTGLPADEDIAKDIESYFDDETKTVTLPEDKKQTDAAALQASETLRQHMTEKLHSLGYYDGEVTFVAGKETWAGTFTLKPGERYTIAKVTITGANPDEKEREYITPLTDLKGLPLDAQTVLDAKDDVQRRMDRRSCRYGTVIEHTAIIDRTRKTADLLFTFKQGPEATLGAVHFTGQQTVNESYLQKTIPWKDGDCFRQSKVEDLRGTLFQSGLFSGVDIVMPKSPAKDGRVDMTVQVTERPHRSFNAGMTYYSDEGPGLSLGWKHRNLLGGAEVLDAVLKLSSIEQSLQSTLTSPYFLRKDQKLLLNAGVKNEDTDAYESKSITTGASVSRALTRRLSVSTGVNFTYSQITDNLTLEDKDFGLISFPQTIAYDSRNNPLDAKRGWFIEADAEPYFNTLGSAAPFVKMSATVRHYHSLGDNTVVALRAKVGAIQGATLADVPADERFYAGGSGSVRGFAYQSIGPQRGGDPAGGRGLAEGTFEVRHKITEDYGAVAFVDAGSLTEESAPDFSQTSVGAGVGLRYYTAVGPIRFDIATPINNQDQTADKVQFYISLGQAF